ncbi:MAG: YkvA family protein [Xanthomonadales bacterium]|nr:YkvA family protein [Xanthomonadales bacterium]
MIAMVEDRGFALPEPERQHVLSALTYFADPKDLIPDSVPVFGFLDDAVMVELVTRELRHELEAYEDFCRFRELEARRRGVDPSSLERAAWLEARRRELHLRMRRRRKAERERLLASGRGPRLRLW